MEKDGILRIKRNDDRSVGEKLKIYCAQCKRGTNHLVLKSVNIEHSKVIDIDHDGFEITIDCSDDYQIIQCQGCETVSFRHENWFSEDVDYDSDGRIIYLYPKRSEDMYHIGYHYEVPKVLQQIYRETIDCFNNGSFILCAAGLRAIVEGICADQNVTDGPVEPKNNKNDGMGAPNEEKRSKNLQGKIGGLKEKGILTETHANILHEHRYLGNGAIHELSSPSKNELAIAIEVIEKTFDIVYGLSDKADILCRRKASKNEK